MLKFHVDLHSVNSEGESEDVKFTTIVNAEDAEGAKQQAQSLLKKQQPEFTAQDSWEWTVYEFPLG